MNTPNNQQGQFNEEYMEALLIWIGDNHIQFTDGEWYHEDDKDGDQPISEKELVKQFVFRNPLPTQPTPEGISPEQVLTRNGIINREYALQQPKPFTTETLHMQISGDKYAAVLKSMKEYASLQPSAKEEGKEIAFLDWSADNYFERDDSGLWYKWMLREKDERSYTTQELYTLFLKSLNDKK